MKYLGQALSDLIMKDYIGQILGAFLLFSAIWLSLAKSRKNPGITLLVVFLCLVGYFLYKYEGGFPKAPTTIIHPNDIPTADPSTGVSTMPKGGMSGDMTVGDSYTDPVSEDRFVISAIDLNSNTVNFDVYPSGGGIGNKYQIYCDDQNHTLVVQNGQYSIGATNIKLIDSKNYIKFKIKKL
jgi:hypothetical protein